MIIILRIKNPLKWCLWLLLMKQSGINPEWSIWIIESLIFSHFTDLGPDLYDSDGQKAPFLLTLGCRPWTADGTVSKGSWKNNDLDAQRKNNSNKSTPSLNHRSPNTSPSLQVLRRLLWAAETTKVLLINWHKPPSLPNIPLIAQRCLALSLPCQAQAETGMSPTGHSWPPEKPQVKPLTED